MKRFDFAVANRHFQQKSWTNGIDVNNDIFKRFAVARPPKNGDLPFFLHLEIVKEPWKSRVILPMEYSSGNKEAVIRKYLVDQGYIRAIISLPQTYFMELEFRHAS